MLFAKDGVDVPPQTGRGQLWWQEQLLGWAVPPLWGSQAVPRDWHVLEMALHCSQLSPWLSQGLPAVAGLRGHLGTGLWGLCRGCQNWTSSLSTVGW